jgi:hypothetical protein
MEHCYDARNNLTKNAHPEMAHLRGLINCVMAIIKPVEHPPTFTSSLTFPSFYFTGALYHVYVHLYFFTFPGALKNNFPLITPQRTETI